MQSTNLRLIVVFTFTFCLLAFAGRADEPVIRDGDRIALVGNTFADQMRKYGYLEVGLRQQAPSISMRHLGWAGDTVAVRARPTNFESEDDSLARHQTDVILICFGMGEALEGIEKLEAFKKDLLGLINHYQGKKYNGENPPRLVLVTPIAGEDLGARTPHFARHRKSLATYAAAMQEMASARKFVCIDLFTPSRDQSGLTTNGIHLNEQGYRWASAVMGSALFPATRVSVDASVPGATVKPVSGGVAWDLGASWAPQRWIQIKNLPPAYYTLSIDGERSMTATHEAWAQGLYVPLPASTEVEVLRKAVVDKNDQFTYAWKALNQVHIVGERKKSNSGRALPEEVQVFHRLTTERDAALPQLHPPEKVQQLRLLANPERKLP